MITDNGHGRCYATCDGPDCDENIIDLNPNREWTERVLQTFFGWRPLLGGGHLCRGCVTKKEEKNVVTDKGAAVRSRSGVFRGHRRTDDRACDAR